MTHRWFLVAMVCLLTRLVLAQEPCQSGPAPGQRPGPYAFVVSTGPNRGKAHCFICEAENRPMAIVFARRLDDATGRLLQRLDQALVRYRDQELRAWATFLHEDQPAFHPKLTEWARKHRLSHLSVGIFEDEAGPPTYRLNRDAHVTVLLAVKQKVVFNFAFRPGELTDQRIEDILRCLAKILESSGT